MIFSNQTSRHQAPAIIILLLPLRVSLCQFNCEVDQNLKHNVSSGRSWGGAQCLKVWQKKSSKHKVLLAAGRRWGLRHRRSRQSFGSWGKSNNQVLPMREKNENIKSINLTKSALALYFVFQVSSFTRDDLGVGWGGGWRVSR